MNKILLIEDDDKIARIILFYLGKNPDYDVQWVQTAADALNSIDSRTDIILLDICLPDCNGVDLCARIRESVYCPIIFISCLDDEETMVKALEVGGDDYLTKPFSGKLLETHIQANLRRVRIDRNRLNSCSDKKAIVFEDFTVDCEKRIIIRDNEINHPAPIEYEILMYFIDNPNRIISIDELYEKVWGIPCYGDVRTVVTHVYNLRKIIEPHYTKSKYICNVRGSGYYFQPFT